MFRMMRGRRGEGGDDGETLYDDYRKTAKAKILDWTVPMETEYKVMIMEYYITHFSNYSSTEELSGPIYDLERELRKLPLQLYRQHYFCLYDVINK